MAHNLLEKLISMQFNLNIQLHNEIFGNIVENIYIINLNKFIIII